MNCGYINSLWRVMELSNNWGKDSQGFGWKLQCFVLLEKNSGTWTLLPSWFMCSSNSIGRISVKNGMTGLRVDNNEDSSNSDRGNKTMKNQDQQTRYRCAFVLTFGRGWGTDPNNDVRIRINVQIHRPEQQCREIWELWKRWYQGRILMNRNGRRLIWGYF